MQENKRAPVGRPPSMEAPRQTILAHAARLFAENGFEQTSLQDVARSVGISKAAVYHYFQSKQLLYDDIVTGLLEGLHENAQKCLAEESDPEKKLKTFMLAHADYFDRNYIGFVTLLHGVSGLGEQITNDKQIAVRDEYEMLLRDILSDGVKAGRLVVGDIAIAARGVLSMINWMSRWYRPDGPKGAVEIVEQYYAMIYKGLRASD